MAETAIQIRHLQAADHAAVLDIYNHYVVHNHCTFDDVPLTLAQRQPWYSQFSIDGPHQCLVAADATGPIGYACSTPFKAKPGYRTSVDVSVYVHHEAQATGVGTAMYERLFEALQHQPVHRIYAGIALPNPGSLALHKQFGFNEVAHYREVGIKFGKYWDVVWLERPNPAP